jgi:hypothetical protein
MVHVMRTTDEGRRWRGALKRTLTGALVASLLLTAGCPGLRQRREPVETSGFLGDYSQLQKNDQYKAYLSYVNPTADWSKYNAIMIDSVAMWGSQDDKLSPEDRQMIAGFMYNALHDTLGKNFAIVNSPGVSVLRLRAAITEAKGSKVALNVVTSVVPQLKVLTTIGGMAADTASIVGEAGAEMELVDSVTGVRLAAAVDRQTGTKALIRGGSKFSTWGDVKEACEYWAGRVDKFLVDNGVRQISAAQ